MMASRKSRRLFPRRRAPRGYALLVMLAILTTGILYFLVGRLTSTAAANRQAASKAAALAEVKEALIDTAVIQPIISAGRLPLPDLGTGMREGVAAGVGVPGNNTDYSVIGKVPWATLGIPVAREGSGECLWYAISGRFKSTPLTATFNWDTQGQFDIIDGTGTAVATNIVALIIAPGATIDGQNRAASGPASPQCGGNYDARNYLDSFDVVDSVSGEVNYFPGSINDRLASTAANKRFVATANGHYNDQILTITSDDIFRRIIVRKDFATAIANLMDDTTFQSHLKEISILGTKGTDNVDCKQTATGDNRTFCNNWKEMFLLTELPTPSSIGIDGTASEVCSRVLIFGGQKTLSQARVLPTEKSNPANYLEGSNLTAFAVPIALSTAFSGTTQFKWRAPSADLVRCLKP